MNSENSATKLTAQLKNVAVFQIIFGLYGIAAYTAKAIIPPEERPKFADADIARFWVHITGALVSGIALILAILLLRGARKPDLMLCQIWMYSQFLFIFHFGVQIFAASAGLGRHEIDTADIVGSSLPLIVQLYFAWIVYKIIGNLKNVHYEEV